MLWENLREPEFKDAVKTSKGLCVVPIGCLEKHGPHSPLGTDTIIAEGIAKLAAEKEPVVIFPTMYFGDKTGAGEFLGTVIFSEATRWAIFKETCNEICRNGFKKILFCNGHGGNNPMLSTFCRAMMQENPDVITFIRGTSENLRGYDNLRAMMEDRENHPYLTDEDRASMQDFMDKEKKMGHAGYYETGMTYYFKPETIRLDLMDAESGESVHRFDEFAKRKITTHFSFMGDYPNSYSGSGGYVMNERIGRALAERAANGFAEVYKFLKNETISNEYHAEWIKKQ